MNTNKKPKTVRNIKLTKITRVLLEFYEQNVKYVKINLRNPENSVHNM